MSETTNRVSLKDAIESLRQQLSEAIKQAQRLGKDQLKFRVNTVELELTIVAEDSVSGGGELGWWIFKARADVSAKDATTHKVKLSLNVGDIEVGACD
jgi:hypothetical protein